MIASKSWVKGYESNLLIPISYQPDGVYLGYFKLRSFDQTEFIVWNNKGLQHWVGLQRYRD